MNTSVSIIIPAYNEASRIGSVLAPLVGKYEVVVVDDASTDETPAIARDLGAEVLEKSQNAGYLDSLRRGFNQAGGEIFVTMDADGEHSPTDVPKLLEPIRSGNYDLVFGARDSIPRPSERVLNRMARLAVDVSDTGTGFRALRASLAGQLRLDTACTCGTFALEATYYGARIGEVSVQTPTIDKPRSIAWDHAWQLFHVLRWLRRVS